MKHVKSRRFLIVISAFLVAGLYLAYGCGGGSSTPFSVDLSVRANQQIYTTDPVSVTFTQAMNKESVEAAFTITGSDPVPGTFSWDENTLTFTRESGLWKTNHTYTLTITTAAKTSAQTPIPEPIEITFTPRINQHDVNGDGIDDFMLSAPTSTFNGKAGAGTVYLFLGKKEWSNIDLASATADATYGFEMSGVGLGLQARIVGDINGDGYADIAISAVSGPPSVLMIIYGSAEPSSITLTEIDDTIPSTFATLNQLNGIAFSSSDVSVLGFPITPAGDVNGDGLGDFLVSARYSPAPDQNTRFWLVLGRTEAFPPHTTDLTTMPTIDAISNAKYTVFGDLFAPGSAGLAAAVCDINGDELNDLIFGSPETTVNSVARVGKVFVVAGSESPSDRDLIATAADGTITGTGDSSMTGAALACGDVTGDGNADIIVGAPGYNQGAGRSYLIAGTGSFSNVDLASAQPLATYTGRPSTGTVNSYFASTSVVLGDTNGDGIDDYIFGAPGQAVDGTNLRGQMYLFLGSQSPTTSVDFSGNGTANATYSGPIPPNPTSPGNLSVLGSAKRIGDVNGDGYDDILIGAPMASEGGILDRGIVYLIFGSQEPSGIDFASGSANVSILGAAAGDKLTIILSFL